MKEFEKLNRIGEGTYGIVCECGAGWLPSRPGMGLVPGWKDGHLPWERSVLGRGAAELRLRGGSVVPVPHR